MLWKRLQWFGTLVVTEVGTWLAWKQVASTLPPWSQGVVVSIVLAGFLLYYPWTQNPDGSTERPVNFLRTRGRGNISINTGANSPASGVITNTGKGTVNNNGLSPEHFLELKRHVDDQVLDKVELYADRRMEAFKTEIVKITGEAHTQALAMGKHVICGFIEQLTARHPENIESLGTADMQHAILNAQTAAAITNDEILADTLIDILVDKSGTEARSYKGVVLNEALDVAKKLTAAQVDLVTAILILAQTVDHSANSVDKVLDPIETRCRPLYGKLPTDKSTLQYLQYTGVGSAQAFRPGSMIEIISRTYDAVFTRGFALNELPEGLRSDPLHGGIPLVDGRLAADASNRRFDIGSSQTLKTWRDRGSLNEPFASHVDEIGELIEGHEAPIDKVTAVFESSYPELYRFLRQLDDVEANTFTLTSVGMAIGQANWRRLDAESAPSVDIYLN